MHESDDWTNTEGGAGSDAARDRALDRALCRVLEPPAVSAAFRARLREAMAREGSVLEESRRCLEQERRERLAELEASYVRLRRRTLGALVGGAFVSGVVLALAVPWLQARLGAAMPLALYGAGAAIALAVGIASLRGVRLSV